MLDGKLSVVMPAYNEAAYIESNVLETVETLSALNLDFEIIVVDDGSPDDTHRHAVRACMSHPERVRVVRYDRNRGKGNALMCGASYAHGEYIAFLDADMDLHPRQLPTLLAIMEAKNADIVIGSKRHPLSNVNYPRVRKVLSAGYFWFIRALFGMPLRDTQTGLKIFKRTVVNDVFPRVLAKRFAFDVEILAVAHNRRYRITDAPVTLEFNRSFSRINVRDIYNTFLDTLAIFYRLKLVRYYDVKHDMSVAADATSRYEAREVHHDDLLGV